MLFGQHFYGEPPRNLNHVFLRQFENGFNKRIGMITFKNQNDRATLIENEKPHEMNWSKTKVLDHARNMKERKIRARGILHRQQATINEHSEAVELKRAAPGVQYWQSSIDFLLGVQYWQSSIDFLLGVQYWQSSIDFLLGVQYWQSSIDLLLGVQYWQSSIDLLLGVQNWQSGIDLLLGVQYWQSSIDLPSHVSCKSSTWSAKLAV